MKKVLISLPDELASRMRSMIPDRSRSKVIASLIEQELNRREEALYQCALELEKDEKFNKEMADWESTSGDGIDDEAW